PLDHLRPNFHYGHIEYFSALSASRPALQHHHQHRRAVSAAMVLMEQFQDEDNLLSLHILASDSPSAMVSVELETEEDFIIDMGFTIAEDKSLVDEARVKHMHGEDFT
ncbi:hypothetical protein BGZ98_005100, partial [Dissophora globulifera]